MSEVSEKRGDLSSDFFLHVSGLECLSLDVVSLSVERCFLLVVDFECVCVCVCV